MRKLLTVLFVSMLLVGYSSCKDDNAVDNTDIQKLQSEIDALKAQLASSIQNVQFSGDNMILSFANGSSLTVPTPSNIIPYIGSNGNWWANGQDLGVKAQADAVVPTIGSNGNWYINGVDSGVKAEGKDGKDGENGKDGDNGLDGTGIKSITYDETTGVLTITLTDGSTSSFVLKSGGSEGGLSGDKLDDSEPYLLTTIWNGDFPFAKFEYDNSDRLTSIVYYENRLNDTVRLASFHRTYNSNGKPDVSTVRYYATQDGVISIDDKNKYLDYYSCIGEKYTTKQLFSKLFPSGVNYIDSNGKNKKYTGGDDDRNRLIIDALMRNDYNCGYNGFVIVDGKNYIINYYYNDGYEFIFTPLTDTDYALSKIDGVDVILTNKRPNSFDRDLDDDYYYNYDYNKRYDTFAFLSSYNDQVLFSEEDSYNDIIIALETTNIGYNYFNYYYLAWTTLSKPDGNIDGQVGKYVGDYVYVSNDEMANFRSTPTSSNWVYLARNLKICNKGDVLENARLKYTYSGNDFTANESHDGESQDLAYIVMDGNRISKFQVIEDGVKKDAAKVNYAANGSIESVDYIYGGENISGCMKVVYDDKLNPVELKVDASQIQKIDNFSELFIFLGLAYRQEAYDKDYGAIVSKTVYAKELNTLFKASYNYSLKNFFKHTFSAFNPIIEGFTMNNAISEIGWAGHGSCLMTEYLDYNGGGYPLKAKAILQVSPTDFTDSEYQIPVNLGGVAITFKFDYKLKANR